jgi:hypothetical protein
MYRCVVEGDCVMGGDVAGIDVAGIDVAGVDVAGAGFWIWGEASESLAACSILAVTHSEGAAFAQAAASRPPAIEIQEISNNRLRMPRGGVE